MRAISGLREELQSEEVWKISIRSFQCNIYIQTIHDFRRKSKNRLPAVTLTLRGFLLSVILKFADCNLRRGEKSALHTTTRNGKGELKKDTRERDKPRRGRACERRKKQEYKPEEFLERRGRNSIQEVDSVLKLRISQQLIWFSRLILGIWMSVRFYSRQGKERRNLVCDWGITYVSSTKNWLLCSPFPLPCRFSSRLSYALS